MKRSFLLLTILFFSISLFAQEKSLNKSELSKVVNDHKVIAILPFKASIFLDPLELQRLEEEDLDYITEGEGYLIQEAMFSWFEKQNVKDDLWVKVQNIDSTNSLLYDYLITYDNLFNYSPERLAKLLNVDAVIHGSFITNKPLSKEAVFDVGIYNDFSYSDKQATIDLYITGAVDGITILYVQKEISSTFGNTSNSLINYIMRGLARRVPYLNKKR